MAFLAISLWRCTWLASASSCFLSSVQVRRLLLFFLNIYLFIYLFHGSSCLMCKYGFGLIRHMLTIVDNEEFYEQEKPLSLKDIRHLIVILREVLFCDKCLV